MPAYKTIALEMLRSQPELYERLRTNRQLLWTVNAYATELKASHEAWMDRLGQSSPGSDPIQTASEAMEMATAELQERLCSASPPNETDALSLDAAMSFLRHSPSA